MGKWIRITEIRKKGTEQIKLHISLHLIFFNDPTTILGPRSVPSNRGVVPNLREEGLCLQLLVRERRGGHDGPRPLQLHRGDPFSARGAVPGQCVFGPRRLRLARRAGQTDQKLQRGRQPLHLVHYGGAL